MVAAAAVVAVAGVSAVVVTVAAAEVSAEVAAAEAVAEVSTGDHQVVVHREEAVMEAYGTQAAGLRVPEASVEASAVAALIVEAGQERGTGAALIAVARPERGTGAVFRINAPDVRILAERIKADGRTHGQREWTHAQIVSTSVAMM